jgi:hypothetical protein
VPTPKIGDGSVQSVWLRAACGPLELVATAEMDGVDVYERDPMRFCVMRVAAATPSVVWIAFVGDEIRSLRPGLP